VSVLVRFVIFSCFTLRFFQITFFTIFYFIFYLLQISPNFVLIANESNFIFKKQSNFSFYYFQNSPNFFSFLQFSPQFLSNCRLVQECHTSQSSPHVTFQLDQRPHGSLYKAGHCTSQKEPIESTPHHQQNPFSLSWQLQIKFTKNSQKTHEP